MNKKMFPAIACSFVSCIAICGCNNTSETTTTASVTEAVTTVVSESESVEETTEDLEALRPALPQKPSQGMEEQVYEAELAAFTGSAFANSDEACSGGGYADGLFHSQTDDAAADAITFTVDVPYDYYYDLSFVANSGGAKKYNDILLDGSAIGEIKTEASKYEDCLMEHVYMSAGEHTISVSTSWGYTKIDCLKVNLGSENDYSMYEVSSELINPNADDNTKRLMKYLTDVYGKYILTGQYSDNGFIGFEMQAIKLQTEKVPAVLGMDMMDYTPSRVEKGSSSKTVENAIDFWNRGGIVTLCWHWNAPTEYLTGLWYSGFRAEATNINLKKIMNGDDEQGYELLMRDIDAIAEELKKLQDAGVPILWRPLHEASGGWFWWGASGAEAYKKLWITMYERLTYEHGLNNLIWLWNGQDGDWYPGDEYVDIIGEDIYAGYQADASQYSRFIQAAGYSKTNKMIVLSENGCVIDPEKAYIDGAMWGFYCTWSGDYVLKVSGFNKYSEKYTSLETLKKMYSSPLSITLDELPDLKNYPLN